jgi:benzoate transport
MRGPKAFGDPRESLTSGPMGWPQRLAIGTTLVLSGLDGFDLLAISFASPGIAAEWHVDRATLGVVLSMELVGMSAGSIGLGRLADRIGRRPVIQVCLVLMVVGMIMATFARGTVDLSAWRLLTGLGIGGLLAITTTVASEFSSDARRALMVSLMAVGYPIGVTVGGAICAVLLREHGWRWVFYVGASMTAVCIPMALAFVPESVQWLIVTRPKRSLERINRTLIWMGRNPLSALPPLHGGAQRAPRPALFSPELRAFTVLSTLAYCFHIFTYFYLLKWLPTLIVDMGYSASAAVGVLVWTNVGAIVGGLLLGVLAKDVGLRRLSVIAIVASAAMVCGLGFVPHRLTDLSLLCAAAGVCITAGIVGIYAILASGYPSAARASGTGFGMGVGRIGSALAPISAGLLFRSGHGVAGVSAVMALGSLLSAVAILILRFPTSGATGADIQ